MATVIRLLSHGIINADLLITHRFTLENAIEALTLSSYAVMVASKLLLKINNILYLNFIELRI